jgi:hypothetical protein
MHKLKASKFQSPLGTQINEGASAIKIKGRISKVT